MVLGGLGSFVAGNPQPPPYGFGQKAGEFSGPVGGNPVPLVHSVGQTSGVLFVTALSGSRKYSGRDFPEKLAPCAEDAVKAIQGQEWTITKAPTRDMVAEDNFGEPLGGSLEENPTVRDGSCQNWPLLHANAAAVHQVGRSVLQGAPEGALVTTGQDPMPTGQTLIPVAEMMGILHDERCAFHLPHDTPRVRHHILYFSEDESSGSDLSEERGTHWVRMVTGGSGGDTPQEGESTRSIADFERRLLPERPSSPPTGLVPLPAMEVSFDDTEMVEPTQPSTLEPMALWGEIARLHRKLEKFGQGYARGHGALQTWQGKLNNMANMVMDLHTKLGELAHRFLNIEAQEPLVHISSLFAQHRDLEGKLTQLQRGFGQWTAYTQSLHDTLTPQMAQVQSKLRELGNRVDTVHQNCEHFFNQEAAQKLAQRAEVQQTAAEFQQQVHEQVQKAIADFHGATRGVDTNRMGAAESRLAQVEQAVANFPQRGVTHEELNTLYDRLYELERRASATDQGMSRLGQLEAEQEARFQRIEEQMWTVSSQTPPAVTIPPIPVEARSVTGFHLSEPLPPMSSFSGHRTALGGGSKGGEGVVRPVRLVSREGTVPPVPEPVLEYLADAQYWRAQPSEAGDFERSSVAGVRAIGKLPPALQPVIQEMLKSQPKKIFSGNPSDFKAWKKAWDSFEKTLKASSGGLAIPDMALLKILEGWLDEATQKQLRTHLEAQPVLRFQEFMSSCAANLILCPVGKSVTSGGTPKSNWRGGASRLRTGANSRSTSKKIWLVSNLLRPKISGSTCSNNCPKGSVTNSSKKKWRAPKINTGSRCISLRQLIGRM